VHVLEQLQRVRLQRGRPIRMRHASLFVPREELRETVRAIARDPSFAQGMRFIAMLQMGIGMIIAVVSLASYLLW
jgi:hypothetical protein